MEISMIILCLLPSVITSITVSSNGNSPEIKLIGGMMVDAQRGFVPVSPMPKLEERTAKSKNKINTTKLSINERYRRLIPYMTFYYANDLVVPTTEAHTTKSLVEVEKVQIVEASALDKTNQREAKKIFYTPHRNIPRYQGNRLTQFNIASANPAHIYKEAIPTHQNIARVTTNFNPLIKEQNILTNHDYGRFVQKPIVKSPSVPFSLPTRKPYLNIQHNEDTANVPYYLSDKELVPKFKLVPYEQTPPVKFVSQNDNIYDSHKIPIPVPVLIPKEQVYIKPRPASPQYVYDNVNNQEQVGRKPATISESYYDKRPHGTLVQPVIEGGFRPIVNPFLLTTEAPIYTSTVLETSSPRFESQKQHPVQVVETATAALQVKDNRASYYPFKVANPPINEEPTYRPSTVPSNTITLGDLLNSLQLSKSIPKPITRENVGSSIRTLLQVLNALKATLQQNEVEAPVLSTPQPFVAPEVVVEVAPKQVETTPAPFADPELHHEPYLAPVNIPSQHIDDIRNSGGTTQQFPLPVTSDDEGGTPGRPGVDYPVLTTIPHTSFNCKTQRYKGFFADPETRCQVWHYCDLNGGQASFLCPNGTIFSQAALTCDWWFNVRCASTTQLYVLNESLYKYILPHTPKFPEDYSGPLVDKYLTLKFKEMEEQFKKNKNKQKAKEKIDSDETEDSSDEESEKNLEKNDTDSGKSDGSTVSEASVNVQTSGTSGNVERLRD